MACDGWLDTTIYCALNASRMPPNVGYFTFVAAVVMCVVDNADTPIITIDNNFPGS